MFPVLSANSATGYFLTKSLRFRSGASAYMNRTPGSNGSQQKFTFSLWVKRGILSGSAQYSLFTADNGSDYCYFRFLNDQLSFLWAPSAGNGYGSITTAVFRDPSAWYNIILSVDTTQATAVNRVNIYVNNVLQTVTPTGSGAAYVPQNTNTYINSTYPQQLGAFTRISQYFDGEMAEVYMIDGQALTPSSFGSTNALTGVWQPAQYTGTYGTNGFYLKFTNTTSTTTLGYDSSGNGNNWTTNNFSLTTGATYDSMTDVPTLTSATAANFDTFNPLASASAPTNGNLSAAGTAPQLWRSTIALPTTGKFYAELYCTDTNGSQRDGFGIQKINTASTGIGLDTAGYAYCGALGQVFTNGSATISSLSTWTNGDTVQIAIDCATGYVWFGKNNTWQASGNPATGANPMLTITGISDYCVAFGTVAANTWYASGNINFGQQPFTYTSPSGYVALNTYNLPDSTIVAGNKVMDATLYTGNGSTQSITNADGFKPDLVWGKCRSNSYNHALVDSNRGVSRWLGSNSTSAEIYTAGDFLTAFNSNGFSVGSAGVYNANAESYVAWQWQAGQGTTSSNTSGSITSTVSVNATAGFSIATITMPTSGVGTFGHGLSVAPSLVILKGRSNATGWAVYHASTGNTGYTVLNTTAAFTTDANAFNNTSPTSSVFTIGTTFNNLGTYVAYCWAQVAGFSQFGSYVGNGSTDGPFVYLGFRPKFLMIKCSSSTMNWVILDTSRNTFNVAGSLLYPNDSAAEGTLASLDILSNGFKLRDATGGWINSSGSTFIYAAFAENPFKNALAR